MFYCFVFFLYYAHSNFAFLFDYFVDFDDFTYFYVFGDLYVFFGLNDFKGYDYFYAFLYWPDFAAHGFGYKPY